MLSGRFLIWQTSLFSHFIAQLMSGHRLYQGSKRLASKFMLNMIFYSLNVGVVHASAPPRCPFTVDLFLSDHQIVALVSVLPLEILKIALQIFQG